eukprot:scaffold38561_cov23-Tisochrysis_lutea.AAC.2
MTCWCNVVAYDMKQEHASSQLAAQRQRFARLNADDIPSSPPGQPGLVEGGPWVRTDRPANTTVSLSPHMQMCLFSPQN